MRREAVLWSLAIAAAIILGLVVIWAAIALAFGQPNLAPLYFSAAPYRQDDYSAENVTTARLNPLDPNLVEEVLLEDQARGLPVLKISYFLEPPNPAVSTPIPSAPANQPLPAATDPVLPAIVSTSAPKTPLAAAPTTPPLVSANTAVPVATQLPVPAPTLPPPPVSRPTKLPGNNGNANGNGSGTGNGNGNGNGAGSGNGNGTGAGTGNGNGNGVGTGSENGTGNGGGNGNGKKP